MKGDGEILSLPLLLTLPSSLSRESLYKYKTLQLCIFFAKFSNQATHMYTTVHQEVGTHLLQFTFL